METSIIERKLTDGSKTYAVVFVEGSARVDIECEDRRHASQLAEAFHAFALYAIVHSA